jgi:hypothetical protein
VPTLLRNTMLPSLAEVRSGGKYMVYIGIEEGLVNYNGNKNDYDWSIPVASSFPIHT